jgi:DNA replicative helicase MCM subunit Mcm2 (Cdc46/Mcm family)
MLESLIRMTEAHARLYMKSEASVFDAISVVVLVEHTLDSCLFGLEPTPSVIFNNVDDYHQIRDNIMTRLELDPTRLKNPKKEVSRRCRTPSPIRRIEDSNNLTFSNCNMYAHDS